MANSLITTPEKVTWDFLREEGLKHLEGMTGHIWSDYSIHDPGVTIFEVLCYAITDLGTRLSLDIEDILADAPGEESQKKFFSPGEILTVNPITVNDYRKLLADIRIDIGNIKNVPCIKNAWLEPATDARPVLYYDKDNNALSYDYTAGSQRIALNGLYKVYIEKDERVTNNYQLTQAVKEKLHAHRNICEDFEEINIMEQETVSMFSDIQIDENADAAEVMAGIYFDLEKFISPRIRQYSLKRMMEKGKSVDEIFTGPHLENGFIDNTELGTDTKRRELHTSDLIRIIMSHNEVKDVRNLFLSNKPNPNMSDKNEWALALDDTKAPVLESFNSTKIRLFKGDTLCPVSSNTVSALIEKIKIQSENEIFDDPAVDLLQSDGQYTAITDYESIAHRFPENYGTSEAGLPLQATEKRKAQAKQLRAYLLFFEQMLVNYFKQIQSFKNIFSVNQDKENILKTYFSQLLPDSAWETDFPEIIRGYNFDEIDHNTNAQTDGNAFRRKDRILNHLIAQFNEKFADYALFGYKFNTGLTIDSEQKESYFLKAKAQFLGNYPVLSKNRNRAYNYYADTAGINVSDGLKDLLSAKLGLDAHINDPENKKELKNFHVVEHILLKPEGSLFLNFISSEKITETYQPDPYSYRLTYIIPKNVERFSNSTFKELVYTTIEAETPAHISYTILELNQNAMNDFNDTYARYMTELRTIARNNLDLNNKYRNRLIEILGLGRTSLPLLHLDASRVDGKGMQQDNMLVTIWKDLSRNSNDAITATPSFPKFVSAGERGRPFIRFDDASCLKISNRIIENDFSIAVVYKATVTGENDEQPFTIITGSDPAIPNFGLSYTKGGVVTATIENDAIQLNTTSAIPHIALLTRNASTGKCTLYLDGAVHGVTTAQNPEISFAQNSIIIGSGSKSAVCEIGEVILLDSALVGSRKAALEEYLSEKWGIAISEVDSIKRSALHLDASHVSSVIRNESTGSIIKWNDLSLNGIIVAPNKPSTAPTFISDKINGLPAIHFNNSRLDIPNNGNNKLFTGNFTLAIVYRAEKGDALLLDGSLQDSSNGYHGFDLSIAHKGAIKIHTSSANIQIPADLKDTHVAVITGGPAFKGSLLSVYVDGKSYKTAASGALNIFDNVPDILSLGHSLAGTAGFTGDISELVVYNEALSMRERQQLEGYLCEKWNIDITGVNRIASPILHLDASKISSVKYEKIVKEDSSVVNKTYAWEDHSFFKNDAVQTNNYRQPGFTETGINNLGSILYAHESYDKNDYYEDSLVINRILQNDFTIMVAFKADPQFYLNQQSNFIVNEKTQWSEGTALIDADCSGYYNDFGLSLGKNGSNNDAEMIVMGGIGDRINADHTIKSKGLDFDTAHIIIYTRQKATGEIKLYADGLLHAEADLRDNVILNDSKTIKIGAFNSEGSPQNSFHGTIGEIIIFDKVLSDTKRQKIEKYLSAKWQIPLTSLPVDQDRIIAHFDALNADSISKDTDNKVSEWHDVDAISETTALQTASSFMPEYSAEGINRQPALRFNKSSMSVTPTQGLLSDFTVAIVCNAFTAGICVPEWTFGAGIIDTYAVNSKNTFGISVNRNNVLTTRIEGSTINAPFTLNTPHITIVSRLANMVTIHIDGILATRAYEIPSSPMDISTEISIGAIRKLVEESSSKGYFHGDISELVIIDKALDTAERQSFENYLSMKWKIDITGIATLAQPIFHLDASKISTIVQTDDTHKVSKWLDFGGHDTSAVQDIENKQPVHKPDSYNGLGTIRFNKSALTFPRMVQDDFTIITVYKPDPGMAIEDFMPVSRDVFTAIAGVDSSLSNTIWESLRSNKYIDENGNVLSKFAPNTKGFTLSLNDVNLIAIKNAFEKHILRSITECMQKQVAVQTSTFASDIGVDAILSEMIWNEVLTNLYINSDGNVLPLFSPYTPGFTLQINWISLIEAAIINILLAKNWIAGAGLIDGNCSGDRFDVYKRDYGLLIGKNQTLVAGIGLIGERDFKLEINYSQDSLNMGILTRKKDTGIVKLYADKSAPVQLKVARNVTLKDSAQFTIGAVHTGGNYFKGDIAEIIILDTVLSESQITEIQNYLSKKWDIR
jgi:hypothetical protein